MRNDVIRNFQDHMTDQFARTGVELEATPDEALAALYQFAAWVIVSPFAAHSLTQALDQLADAYRAIQLVDPIDPEP